MAYPHPQDSCLLKGYEELRRVNIGEYRIVYKFNDTTIYLVIIGKRNDDEVYRSLVRKS